MRRAFFGDGGLFSAKYEEFRFEHELWRLGAGKVATSKEGMLLRFKQPKVSQSW